MGKKTMKVAKLVETNLDCNGLCRSARFWFFKDVTLGQPDKSCIAAIKTEFDETSGAAAVVMLITNVISGLLLLCSCRLCCKHDD